MDHNASLSAPARRTRRIVIGTLAILGTGIAVLGPGSAVLKILLMPIHRPQWHVWVGTFNGVALITVAALPLAALAVWALARRRRARRQRVGVADVAGRGRHGLRDGAVGLADHAAGRRGRRPRPLSLVPLRDLLTMPGRGLPIVGNLLVFAALGFLAPLRFAALASVPRILALGAGCSVLVETAQYVLRLDRVSSVDDVLLNASGAVLAALASRRWWRATAVDLGAPLHRSPGSVEYRG